MSNVCLDTCISNRYFTWSPPARPILCSRPASSSRIRGIRFPGFGSRFDRGSLSQLERAALVEVFDLTRQRRRRRQRRRAESQIRNHLYDSSRTGVFTSFHKLARALNVLMPMALPRPPVWPYWPPSLSPHRCPLSSDPAQAPVRLPFNAARACRPRLRPPIQIQRKSIQTPPPPPTRLDQIPQLCSKSHFRPLDPITSSIARCVPPTHPAPPTSTFIPLLLPRTDLRPLPLLSGLHHPVLIQTGEVRVSRSPARGALFPIRRLGGERGRGVCR